MATTPRTIKPQDSKEAQGSGDGTTRRRSLWLLELYRSAIGKKYVMAVSGVILMGYVFAHMVGNLKVYLGAAELNAYAEWLRDIGYPALPHSGLLWLMRSVLLVAFVLHLHAAYALTIMNRHARPTRYASKRDYVAADFASRTMRWTGIIVLLFIVWHLLDLTWGPVNPDFVPGDVYHNVVASFQRIPVSLFYVVANLALGVHLYHGAWSLFQSLGINHRRFNHWRRYFAVAFALVVTLGNVTFPIAVMTGIVA
ncbi:MAG: succinate dehydrogenase cytochrome b subunit [Egibacteraceae bacterium]